MYWQIYLYAKDLRDPSTYLWSQSAGIKHLNDSYTLTECSNAIDDVYENIDD